MQCNIIKFFLGMVELRKGKITTQDFMREFECHARDVDIGVAAFKVHLLVALNEDTFRNLDAHVML